MKKDATDRPGLPDMGICGICLAIIFGAAVLIGYDAAADGDRTLLLLQCINVVLVLYCNHLLYTTASHGSKKALNVMLILSRTVLFLAAAGALATVVERNIPHACACWVMVILSNIIKELLKIRKHGKKTQTNIPENGL